MTLARNLQRAMEKLLAEPGEKLAVALILAAGVVARLIWATRAQNITPVVSESHNVAVSLARTGAFAHPFVSDTGFTAHVGMFTPLPSAAAYWLLGPDTKAAELAIILWAIGLVTLSFFLCWRIALALGTPPIARLAALIFVTLLPLQFGLEVREGRSWEVNLAAVLLLIVLLRLIGQDRNGGGSFRHLAVTGAICGFLFILSPPAGLAGAMTIGLYQLMELPPRQWWVAPVAFLVVAGLLAALWAERNSAQLGAAIALRDNFGLEFDLSNYAGAVSPSDPRAAYLARMHNIHPLLGMGVEGMRRAGGEVSYYRSLGAEANSWVGSHIPDFIAMCLRRFREYYLPPQWFWYTFGPPGELLWLRQAAVWSTAIGGLLALAWMARRNRAYGYILVAILFCSAPYVLVQPTLRYRYLVSSLLIFLAFDGLGRILRSSPRIRSGGSD